MQIYSVQVRTPFSVGWQAAATGKKLEISSWVFFAHTIDYSKKFIIIDLFLLPLVPEVINGRTRKATVVDLSPWVEYEFRVVASNSVGIGEPSRPSALLKTKAAGKPLVAGRVFDTDTLAAPDLRTSLQQSHSS